MGGVAAQQAGGNVAKGIIFGALIGAVTAVCVQAVAASMNSLTLGSSVLGKAFAQGVQYGVAGFGSGLITGYAGGAGSASSMFKSAGIGAAIGFGIGFTTSLASSALSSAGQANSSKLGPQKQQQVQEAVKDTNVQKAIDASIPEGVEGQFEAAIEVANQASQPTAPVSTYNYKYDLLYGADKTLANALGEPRGNVLSKAFGWFSSFAEMRNAPKSLVSGFRALSVFFSDMGPFETAGMAFGSNVGQGVGKSIDSALSIDWKWVQPAY